MLNIHLFIKHVNEDDATYYTFKFVQTIEVLGVRTGLQKEIAGSMQTLRQLRHDSYP